MSRVLNLEIFRNFTYSGTNENNNDDIILKTFPLNKSNFYSKQNKTTKTNLFTLCKIDTYLL